MSIEIRTCASRSRTFRDPSTRGGPPLRLVRGKEIARGRGEREKKDSRGYGVRIFVVDPSPSPLPSFHAAFFVQQVPGPGRKCQAICIGAIFFENYPAKSTTQPAGQLVTGLLTKDLRHEFRYGGKKIVGAFDCTE